MALGEDLGEDVNKYTLCQKRVMWRTHLSISLSLGLFLWIGSHNHHLPSSGYKTPHCIYTRVGVKRVRDFYVDCSDHKASKPDSIVLDLHASTLRFKGAEIVYTDVSERWMVKAVDDQVVDSPSSVHSQQLDSSGISHTLKAHFSLW